MATTQHFAVIGLGQLGEQVARRLAEAGREVLAIDIDMARVEAIKDVVPRAVRVDCSSESSMRAVEISEIDVAVMALGESDFESAVLGTAVLKTLGVKTVIARSASPQRGKILSLAGASRVIYPELEMGDQLAQLLLHSNLRAAADLPSGFGLVEVRAPSSVGGRTVEALALRKTFGLSMVTVLRGGESLDPAPALVLEAGDGVLLVGRSAQLAELVRSWGQD